MCPANERWCYYEMSSLIGWAHSQIAPCAMNEIYHHAICYIWHLCVCMYQPLCDIIITCYQTWTGNALQYCKVIYWWGYDKSSSHLSPNKMNVNQQTVTLLIRVYVGINFNNMIFKMNTSCKNCSQMNATDPLSCNKPLFQTMLTQICVNRIFVA